jgi:DNA polymerase III sliding clamp (beta) subunit (PCNA family)
MKIQKENLKKALEIVKPGLASKEMIEQTTSFAFLDGRVITYNDELSVSHPVEGLELTGAIKAEELYKLVSKTTKADIQVVMKGDEIVLKLGNTRAGFTVHSEIKLPLEELNVDKTWKQLPADFCAAISFCSGACSTDMSSPAITGVKLHKTGMVVGGDGYRVAFYEMQKEMKIEEIIIPAQFVKEITKIKPLEMAISNGWAHFKNAEGTELSCRYIDAEYPGVMHLLEEMEGQEMQFPEGITEILDRVSVFASREVEVDEVIEVKFSPKKLVFESRSDAGWIKETEKIDYNGEEVQFQITPYLLKDILSQTNVFYKKEASLFFKSNKWKYFTVLR